MRPTSSLLSGPAPVATAPHAPGFVVVGLDAEADGRLCAALRHGGLEPCEIRRVTCWLAMEWPAELDRLLAAVFDPFAGEPDLPRELAARHPYLRLIAYGRLTPACAPRLSEVLHAGIAAFVTRDVDDTPAGFGHHLRRAGLLGADARG